MASRPISRDTESALIKKEMEGFKARLDQIGSDVHEIRSDREKFYAQQIELATVRIAQTELAKKQSSFESYVEERSKQYVTKDQFDPVRLVVYRTIGTILGAVALAILSLIFVKGGSFP